MKKTMALFLTGVFTFGLLFFLIPDFSYAFQYVDTVNSNSSVSPYYTPQNTDVKIFYANDYFNETFRYAGGRPMVLDFNGDGNNDLIMAAPYHFGDWGGSNNNCNGLLTVAFGPVSATSPDSNFYKTFGNYTSGSSVGYIWGNVGDFLGYAVTSGTINGKKAVIMACAKTAGASEVLILFQRLGTFNPIASTNVPISNTSGNVINMSNANDMKNFAVRIQNISGGNISILNSASPQRLGISLASGDVNNDGVDDIIIGCPGYDSGKGAVYVIKGKTAFASHVPGNDPTIIDAANMTISDGYIIKNTSGATGFGASVMASNVYGNSSDTKKELLIGEPDYSSNGRVTIIPDATVGNTSNGWSATDTNEALTSINNVKFITGTAPGGFGHAMTSGKFHNSSADKSDIVISSYSTSTNSSVKVFYGGDIMSSLYTAGNSYTMAASSFEINIQAAYSVELMGYSLACGDINGDGLDDIAVSAPLGSEITGKNDYSAFKSGLVYLVHGLNYAAGTTLNLGDNTKPFYHSTFKTEGNFKRIQENSFFGFGLAIGNLNSGSRSQLIVGEVAGWPSTESVFPNDKKGATYVYFTSKAPNQPSVTVLPDFIKSNTGLTWTHSDPDGDAQSFYHVQFSKEVNPDFKDFADIVDSGVVAGAAATYTPDIVTKGEGKYYYRVQTGDKYSFSKYSDVKTTIYDKTSPSDVTIDPTDFSNISGKHLLFTNRTIKFKVTDNIQCANSVTAEVWIDKNNNGSIDSGEYQTIIANATNTAIAASYDYSFTLSEPDPTDGEWPIKVWISGCDAAGNYMNTSVGGSSGIAPEQNPKLSYFIHNSGGPTAQNVFKIYDKNNTLISKTLVTGEYVTNDDTPKIETTIIDNDTAITDTSIELSIGANTYTTANGVTVNASGSPVGSHMDATLIPGVAVGSGPNTFKVTKAVDYWGNTLKTPNPYSWSFYVDTTAPTGAEASLSANYKPFGNPSSDSYSSFLKRSANRTVEVDITDNFRTAVSPNTDFEIRFTKDNGATVVSTVSPTLVNAPAEGTTTKYVLQYDDTGCAPGNSVEVWIKSTLVDFAGNAIAAEKRVIKYGVHSDDGPQVSGWTITPVTAGKKKFNKYVNDTLAKITANITDDDSSVGTIELKVQGTKYGPIVPGSNASLSFSMPVLTFIPTSDYITSSNFGTIDVVLLQAYDSFLKPVDSTSNTAETFFIDNSAPALNLANCIPSNNSSTNSVTFNMKLAYDEIGCGMSGTVSIQIHFKGVDYYYFRNVAGKTDDPRITLSGNDVIFDHTTNTNPVFAHDTDPVVVRIQVWDNLGNTEGTKELQFKINTLGPLADPIYPSKTPDYSKFKNNKFIISSKIWSEAVPPNNVIKTSEIEFWVLNRDISYDPSSLVPGIGELKIKPTTASSAVNPYLYYDETSGSLTYQQLLFDPVKNNGYGSFGGYYRDGTNSIIINHAKDTVDNDLQGRPLIWHFICDTCGPHTVYTQAQDTEPTKEVWVNTRQPILKMKVTDDITRIVASTLKLKVTNNSSNWSLTTALNCLSYDWATKWLMFEPSKFTPSAISFADGSVSVELLEAQDEATNILDWDSTENKVKTPSPNINKWFFNLDATLPQISEMSPGPEPPAGNDFRVIPRPVISFKLTDNLSGIDTASVELKLDNTAYTISSLTVSANGVFTFNPLSDLAQGQHTCEVKAQDIAGNKLLSYPTKWNFVIDSSRMEVVEVKNVAPYSPWPPQGSFLNQEKGYYPAVPDNNINPTGGSTDSVFVKVKKTYSGLDTSSISFEVRQGATLKLMTGEVTVISELSDAYVIRWRSKETSPNFVEGTVAVKLNSCKNRAGWDLLTPYSWQFNVDLTSPEVELLASSPNPAEGSFENRLDYPITLSLKDKQNASPAGSPSGVNPDSVTLNVAFNGGGGTDYTITPGGPLTYDKTNQLLKFTPPPNYSNGTVTVTLKSSKDYANNAYFVTGKTLPYSWTFYTDSLNPTLTYTTSATTPSGTTPLLNATTSDNKVKITALLKDDVTGRGIDTASVKLSVVSSILASSIENSITLNSYFTFANDGTLTYDPVLSPNLAGYNNTLPDSKIDVYISAKDRTGNFISPNPGVWSFNVDTTGPVMIDGTAGLTPDSRTPAANTTIGVDTQSVGSTKVEWILRDVPSGVDLTAGNNFSFKFTLQNISGNSITDTSTSAIAIVNNGNGNYKFTYSLPNTNITGAMIGDSCTCTVEILDINDASAFKYALQKKSTNKWTFYINNSAPTAILPYPPDGSIVKDNSVEVGIKLFHAFGIDTSTVEFLYNGNMAQFPASPESYYYEYVEATKLLRFKPNNDVLDPAHVDYRWNEGTNTVILKHAKEKKTFKDLPAFVSWSFKVDTKAPLASGIATNLTSPDIQIVNGNNYINKSNFDVLFSLTDDYGGASAGTGSGINLNTIKITVKNPSNISTSYNWGDPQLTYNGANTLKFTSASAYSAAGTWEITLDTAQDNAGWDYIVNSGSTKPLKYTFSIVSAPPVASIIQPLINSSIADDAYYEIKILLEPASGSPGIDTNSVILNITENGVNNRGDIKIIAGSGLTYDTVTHVLKFAAPTGVPLSEGKINVTLKQAKDKLGQNYTSSPYPLSWNFYLDLNAPELDYSIVTPVNNGIVTQKTQEVVVYIDDGQFGSGIDTNSIRLLPIYYEIGVVSQKTFDTVEIGTNLSLEDSPAAGQPNRKKLTFKPIPEYDDGTAEITLLELKDNAGHSYKIIPASPAVAKPYKLKFTVDLNAPKILDSTLIYKYKLNYNEDGTFKSPASSEILLSQTEAKYINQNDGTISVKIDDGRGSQVNVSTIKLKVLGNVYQCGVDPELNYDTKSLLLTYKPKAANPYPEGSVTVELLQCNDNAGYNGAGSPSGITPPNYKFTFVCDTVRPIAYNQIPQQGSYISDTASTYISVILKDVTSGIETSSVLIRNASNSKEFKINSIIYNPQTYVLLVRPDFGKYKDGSAVDDCTVEVQISGCFDRCANPLTGQPITWQFLLDTKAPTVDMIKPPASARRTKNKDLEFQFAENGSGIDGASIKLSLQYPDLTGRTFTLQDASPNNYLEYDTVTKILKFNKTGLNILPEGTISVSLKGSDLNNHEFSGNWQFQLDTKPPYVIAGSETPPSGSTVGDSLSVIILKVKDDLGKIKLTDNALYMKIVNSNIADASSTFYYSGTPGSPVTFNEDSGEIRFIPENFSGYTNGKKGFSDGPVDIYVTVKDDLENTLSNYHWSFNVNSSTPYVTGSKLVWSSGEAKSGDIINKLGKDTAVLRFDLKTSNSTLLDKSSIRVSINGGAEQAVNDSTIKYTAKGSPLGVTGSLEIAVNSFSLLDNDGPVTVTLKTLKNDLNVAMPTPYNFSFTVDNTGPAVVSVEPADNSVVTNAAVSVKVKINEVNDVDLTQTTFVVNGHEITNSGMSYDKPTKLITFNIASTVLTKYSAGLNNIALKEVKDIAGNSLQNKPKQWKFYVSEAGPAVYLDSFTPKDITTANSNSIISFKLNQTGAITGVTEINDSSFNVTVKNIKSSGGETSWNIIGTDEVHGVTYNKSTFVYSIDPVKYIGSGVNPISTLFEDGTITVTINEVKNFAGNSLQAKPIQWSYYLDKKGPYVVTNSLLCGSIENTISSKSPVLKFAVRDYNNKSNIDKLSFKMGIQYYTSKDTTTEVPILSNDVRISYSVELGEFIFDPSKSSPVLTLPDGTATVVLKELTDSLGNILEPGSKNSFSFVVNTLGPIARNPWPSSGNVVKLTDEISFALSSEISLIDVSKPVKVVVNSKEYSTISDSSLFDISGINNSSKQYRLILKVSQIPASYRPGSGQVTCAITDAYDLLGNRIRPSDDSRLGASNSWSFINDVTPPVMSMPYPPNRGVIGVSDTTVSVTIIDSYSKVKTDSIKIRVNETNEITIPAGNFNSAAGKMEYKLQLNSMVNGINTLEVTAVSDELGNAITKSYIWNVYYDKEPPFVAAGSMSPANGSIGNTLRPTISFELKDNPQAIFGVSYTGDINSSTIRVRIRNIDFGGNVKADKTLKVGDPGVIYFKPKVSIDVASAGLTFSEGSCEITVLGGSVDGVADSYGNRMVSDYKSVFAMIASGPYVFGDTTPARNSTVTNNKQVIKMQLTSDKSQIKLSTLKLAVGGITYSYNAGSTLITYTDSDDTLTFNPTAGGITLREGSIEVKIIACEDELGNKLQADTLGLNPWYFKVDTTGPTATVGANPSSPNYPTSIAVTAKPNETIVGVPRLKAKFGTSAPIEIPIVPIIIDSVTYYTGTLEASSITAEPVTFIFAGKDSNGNETETEVKNLSLAKTKISMPYNIKPQKYYFFSLPLVPVSTDVNTMFSALTPGTYTIWDGIGSSSKVTTTIKPGVGYWLFSSASSDIALEAGGYEMSSPMTKFEIDLKPGWNMVAIPYAARVNAEKCTIFKKFSNGSTSEVPVFSVQNTFTDHAFWSYDYDYNLKTTFSLNHRTGHLMPFCGYYIYSNEYCVLRIPPVFVTNEEVNKYPIPPYGLTLQKSPSDDKNLWYKVSVACQNFKDDYNYFGLSEFASENLANDVELDVMKPYAKELARGGYISSYFNLVKDGTKYASYFQKVEAVRKRWNFNVETDSANQKATISWQALRDTITTFDYELILYDKTDGSTVDMKKYSSYTFTTSAAARQFSIIFNPVGTGGSGGGQSDTTPPKVLSYAPYNNQENVSLTTTLNVYFDKKLNSSTTYNSITLNDLSSGAIVKGKIYYNDSLYEVAFKPDVNLAQGTSYQAVIENIKDNAGNTMTKTIWRFSTAAVDSEDKNVSFSVSKGWNMISVPLYPKAKTIPEIFSSITSQFILYGRKGNQILIYNGDYLDSPMAVEPGRGYWLYMNNDSSIEVKIDGNTLPSTAAYFEIPLVKGFNQLAVPFNYSNNETVNNLNFKFRLNDANASVDDVYVATGKGVIRNNIYTFNKSGVSGSIVTGLLTDTTFKLKKTDAFFIYSNVDNLILRIYRVPQTALSSKKLMALAAKYPNLQRFIGAPAGGRSPKITLDESKYWRVNIGIETANKQFTDSCGFFGIDYVGEDGIDMCDVIKLMPPDPYVAMYFNKTAAGESYVLSSDVRAPLTSPAGSGTASLKWSFDVVSRGVDYQDGYLYWDAKAMPAAGTFMLVDKTLNTETDMRKNPRYKLAIDGNKHNFEIIYTPEMK
ncbi:MAG: Ig-like domain-containing protein [Candidatus Wallbacteria bacterium]